MEFCSFCEISFSSGRRECPLCEANAKINDVLKENEVLRERLDDGQDEPCKICQ